MSRPPRGPINPTFGTETFRYRKNAKAMSACAASQEIGIGRETLWALENAVKSPDIKTFALVCRWRGISADQGLRELGY